jgi:glycerate kinase
MSDGGEGFLEVLGGANRHTTVMGPMGDPVDAPWRLRKRRAVIEMATASGLGLVGGVEGNDAMAASTYGTGELIGAAVEAGAERVLVGMGGSATTDGGLGALRALHPLHRLRAVEFVAACDVRIPFVEAADRFAPQKGATPAEIKLLRRRLERLIAIYHDEHGVDVADLSGAGAAGGLAGGLAAAGAELCPGLDLVADEADLDEAIEDAALVVTGEGFLDDESFEGKVVGGVIEHASQLEVPVLVIVGDVLEGLLATAGLRDDLHEAAVEVVSLTDRFGSVRARAEPASCVEDVVQERLARSV